MSQSPAIELFLKLSKSIRDTIKPLVELQKHAEVNDKLILAEAIDNLIQAQSLIASTQSYYQDILHDNEKLSNRIVQYEQWTEDLSNYESFRLLTGTTVITAKNSDISSYAKEWYCKHCFDNKKKSQLQPMPMVINTLVCPQCKTAYTQSDGDRTRSNNAIEELAQLSKIVKKLES
jgi:Zn finger protein HypA/HybF involved in hydrogenase expression